MMLKKSLHGLFQPAKQKAWFLLCSIFQTRKRLKMCDTSLYHLASR